MLKTDVIKNHFIILLIALSIFFSHAYLFSFPLRFSFLLAFPLLIYEKIYLKKNLILFSVGLITFIFFTSFFTLINYYNINLDFNIFNDVRSKTLLLYFFDKEKIFEFGIMFYLIIFLYHYSNLIKNNLFKIINIFLIIFFISTCFHLIQNPKNLLLFKECTSGFFNLTKFIYKENSHLHLIGVPILCYSIINIKRYFEKPYLLFLVICFFAFSLLNATTTYFISILGSIIFLIIVNKKFFSYQNLFLITFLILNILIFLNSKSCVSSEDKLLPDRINNFKGTLSSPKKKLFELGLHRLFANKKAPYTPNSIDTVEEGYNGLNAGSNYEGDGGTRIGTSFSIPLYSIINSVSVVSKYPFGVGLNQYEKFHEFSFKEYIKNQDVYYGFIYEKLAINILELNKSDGGINFSKLLTEFGILAITIFIALIYLAFSRKMNLEQKSFLLTLLLIQILFRASGYYNNGFLIILILSLITLVRKNEK